MNVSRSLTALVSVGCLVMLICAGCSAPKIGDAIDQGGPDVSGMSDDQLAFRYALTGDASAMQALLSSNPDVVNAIDEGDMRTPLHAAAYAGNDKIVDMLLDSGADPTARDDNGESPADVARQSAHVDLAKKLMAAEQATGEQ